MGVDLSTYRARIGTFRHSVGVDVVTIVCFVNFTGSLKTIGSVLFIGMLLVIAGIEPNPGPTEDELHIRQRKVSEVEGTPCPFVEKTQDVSSEIHDENFTTKMAKDHWLIGLIEATKPFISLIWAETRRLAQIKFAVIVVVICLVIILFYDEVRMLMFMTSLCILLVIGIVMLLAVTGHTSITDCIDVGRKLLTEIRLMFGFENNSGPKLVEDICDKLRSDTENKQQSESKERIEKNQNDQSLENQDTELKATNTVRELDDGNGVRRENTLLDDPWRIFENNGSWTEEYRRELILYIISTTPRDDVNNFKFLLLGPFGAGKSSFVNAVASIDAGEITQVVSCGERTFGITRKLPFYTADQRLQNFVLCDTMGFNDISRHVDECYLLDLLAGRIKPYSKVCQNEKEPTVSDMIHCVALVMDSREIESYLEEHRCYRVLEDMRDTIRGYECPLVIILTKIDSICGEVNRNISMTFRSRNIEKCVKMVSEKFGIPIMNIYPVQNYTKQMGLNCEMDILILMAIKHMIRLANGYIKMKRIHT